MKIRTKTIYPILLIFLGIVVGFYFLILGINKNILDIEHKNLMADRWGEFNNLVEHDTKILGAALDAFLVNQEFKDIFLSGDREELYNKGIPLFEKLKKEYGITHFYFHTPDGYNFLRLHNKDIYGDKITRFTFEKAKNGTNGAGIELGKTAFALRVVKPYYNNDKLIGYVELGEEIDHFLDIIKGETHHDYAVIVDKKYLDKDKWVSVRKAAGLSNNWDDNDKNLVIDSTLEVATSYRSRGCFSDSSVSTVINQGGEVVLDKYSENGEYVCGGFPLYDAGGRKVGAVLVLEDATVFYDIIKKSQFIFLISILVALGLFVIIYYLLIFKFILKPLHDLHIGTEIIERGNLDHKVGIQTEDEIGDLSRSFEEMTVAIKKSYAEVDKKVKQQTKEIVSKQEDMEKQRKAILNILEDVDDEKKKVEREKDKINAILHSIGDAVFVVDENLEITMFNNIAANISGFSIKEAVGQRYDKILNFIFEDTEKVNDVFLKKAMETGKIQEMSNHTILVNKTGDKIPVADSAAPLRDKGGNIIGCVVVFRDVTKEREIDRMKTEFVSVASHQLRTPLTAIRWYIEEMNSGELGKLNDEQKEYMKESLVSTTRMIDLVNSLLNVSRLETGRLSVNPKPTDLMELINTVVNEQKQVAKSKNCTIVVKKLKKKLSSINIDPDLIGEVVANLVSNGVKYSSVDGNKNTVEVSLEIKKPNVVVSVKDSGMGIPKNVQHRIFQKFFRANNAVKSETEGTGLGLYVTRLVIEASGGEIWFKSVENKGTTFSFSLPLAGSKKREGEKGLAS